MHVLPFDVDLRLPATPFSGRVRLLLVPLPEDAPPSADLTLEYSSAPARSAFSHCLARRSMRSCSIPPTTWCRLGKPIRR